MENSGINQFRHFESKVMYGMGAYSFYQESIRPKLEIINSKRESILTKLNDLPAEQKRLISRIEKEAEIKKNDYRKTLDSLSIYIRMGSGGEKSSPSEDGRVSEVNLIKLSEISSKEAADAQGHQKKLWDEANAQYRFVEAEIKLIDSDIVSRAGIIRQQIRSQKQALERELDETESLFMTAFKADEFQQFISLAQAENETEEETHPIVGYVKIPMPISSTAASFLHSSWPGLFDAKAATVTMAYTHDLDKGGVYWIDFDSTSEKSVIDGIQHFAIKAAANHNIEQINFFDPVRFNDDLLGLLSSVAGIKGSPVNRIPFTENEIEKQVLSMQEEVVRWNSDLTNTKPHRSNRVIVFYQFPYEYSNDVIKSIRFLCINARRHGFTVFLLNRPANKNGSQGNDVDYIRENAIYISGQNGDYSLVDTVTMSFIWAASPADLPDRIIRDYQKEDNIIDLDNSYEKRIGFNSVIPNKGNRTLVGIPYGIDNQGNLATLDFEDELFGTFICGASRSGKTTLLHTIISGLLTHHPDDVEIWLIDFKKVEFARYIDHLPPHVRYVLLENSPEIIFDIIDELSLKLHKRKDIFKANGWTKLADVPPNRSMPEVIIIIDEFSEMSGVLANSISLSASSEDYREKFRLLFSEGASFGYRFILSCQAFSEGTRGLAEFAKMQIQQRIVMKSQRSEIKATLDISNLSDEDAHLVENIEPHYALLRVPLDTRGNRLKKAHVLYISEKAEQFSWIDRMHKQFTPIRKYDPDNNTVYGDKLPVIIDGNSYMSYSSMAESIRKYVDEYKRSQQQEGILLFIGDPLRMKKICPIQLFHDYKENILIVSPPPNHMVLSSVLLSIWKSALMQSTQYTVFSMNENNLTKQIRTSSQDKISVVTGKEEILSQLLGLQSLIEKGIRGNSLIIINSLEQIFRKLTPMISTSSPAPRRDYLGIGHRFENSSSVQNNAVETIDYKQILKLLLTDGPAYGYHFVLIFNSAAAFDQLWLPDAFKHKILFKISAQDAQSLMIPSAQASYYSRLGDYEYRYSNGLEKNTYRPYFHPLLSWDNQIMDEDGIIRNVETYNDDDYLV